MSCGKNNETCVNESNVNNNYYTYIIIVVLYILLAIILSTCLNY